jgi:hypothetical protein
MAFFSSHPCRCGLDATAISAFPTTTVTAELDCIARFFWDILEPRTRPLLELFINLARNVSRLAELHVNRLSKLLLQRQALWRTRALRVRQPPPSLVALTSRTWPCSQTQDRKAMKSYTGLQRICSRSRYARLRPYNIFMSKNLLYLHALS